MAIIFLIVIVIAAISIFLFPYAFALMLAAKIVNAKHQSYKIALLASVYLILIALIHVGVLYMLGLLENFANDDSDWFNFIISLFIDSWIFSKVLGTSYSKGFLLYFISGLISSIIYLVIAVLMVLIVLVGRDFNTLFSKTNSQEKNQSVQLEQFEGQSKLDDLD